MFYLFKKPKGKLSEVDCSAEAFLAWAKGRDPDEGYQFTDCTDCAFARYLRSQGVDASVSVGTWRERKGSFYYPYDRRLDFSGALQAKTMGEAVSLLEKNLKGDN